MLSRLCLIGLLSLHVWARPLSHQDLFDFQWIGEVQVAPDGRRAVFVKTMVDAKKTGYDTSLWMVELPAGTPRALTNGTRDRSPRFSPDGRRLAFVRNGALALMPLDGGEAELISDMPRPLSNPMWSPDGTRLAFLCDANDSDNQPKKEGYVSDVSVITRAHYRINGGGNLDFKRYRHLWVQGLSKQKADRLSQGKFNVSSPQYAPDGALFYVSDPRSEPYYDPAYSEIHRLRQGKDELIAQLNLSVHDLTLSPDGRRLAFHAEEPRPIRSYTQPDLYVMSSQGGAPRNLTADYDFDMGSGVNGDNSAPAGGGGSLLCWRGNDLLDVVARRGRAILVSVASDDGEVRELTHGDQAVQGYGFGGGQTVLKISTPTSLNELYSLDGAALTRFHHFDLKAPEELNYKSFDGRSIQAWVQWPPERKPGQKVPLILNIHGGPHAAYGFVFDHEFQCLAARGYAVLYPNPRGSTSYGQEFGNLIQHHYPGDDYKDLMAGVDLLVARGEVDPERLGVTGGSGGGLLTNWTVGHTRRFKAAVSQRDIADWASWWYSADMTLFEPSWFKGAPFENPAEFAERSPITFVKEITTPILFILGDADTRTPPEAGGEQLFRALKYLHRTAAMVRFPRENHDLSRSGEPWHRVERLDHIANWFDRWLLGLPHPEYDLD
ncbi:S9 family peptidase [bacterium]|nr:S9 family peptidase [bacterium]